MGTKYYVEGFHGAEAARNSSRRDTILASDVIVITPQIFVSVWKFWFFLPEKWEMIEHFWLIYFSDICKWKRIIRKIKIKLHTPKNDSLNKILTFLDLLDYTNMNFTLFFRNMLRSVRECERLFIADFSLLIFDEAHHAVKDHAYAVIMRLIKKYDGPRPQVWN